MGFYLNKLLKYFIIFLTMSGATKCFFCLNSFGLFKKQYACSKCGYAACKDCVPHKITLNNRSGLMCRKCYKELHSPAASSGRSSPPANFKRELARKKETHSQQQNNEDLEITKRLEKLKSDMKSSDVSIDELERRVRNLRTQNHSSVTMEEIEARLSKLKGEQRPPAIRVHSIKAPFTDLRNAQPARGRNMKRKMQDGGGGPSTSSLDDDETQVKRLIRQYTNDVITATSSSSRQETADDLIRAATNEVEIDRREQRFDDVLAERSAQLRNNNNNGGNIIPVDDVMDEESAELIRKILEEEQIEENAIQVTTSSNRRMPTNAATTTTTTKTSHHRHQHRQLDSDDDDEDPPLPWCFMCNDDATIKCVECDDLFCRSCYKQVHKDRDMRGHHHRRKPQQHSSNVCAWCYFKEVLTPSLEGVSKL